MQESAAFPSSPRRGPHQQLTVAPEAVTVGTLAISLMQMATHTWARHARSQRGQGRGRHARKPQAGSDLGRPPRPLHPGLAPHRQDEPPPLQQRQQDWRVDR